MKNVTISVTEELWLAMKEQAAQKRVSMNRWLRDLAARETNHDDNPMKALLELADQTAVEAPPWKWNRDEIYAERLDRYSKR